MRFNSQPNNSFDVIIIGAGCAGSLLGYYLACHSIRTLIIEKNTLPRHKICGGGLTKRSLDIIPFDISEVIEHYSYSVHLTIQNRRSFEFRSNTPIIGMVMRDTFDFFLAQKAMRQGATVMDRTTFMSVTGNAGRLTVETSNGRFQAKILVGADGAHGKTADALGLTIQKKHIIGLEAQIIPHTHETFTTIKKTTTFDFGIVPKGYGWVFPKKEHLSVGIVSIRKKLKGMKQHLIHHLEAKNLKDHSTIKSLQGWMIPYSPQKGASFANEKGLLIGDAAGLTDPITGEGIFYSLKEAQIASSIIANKLLLGKGELRRYNDGVEWLRKDLAVAAKLQKLLYHLPRVSYTLMNFYGRKLGEKYLDIISGETTYMDLYRKIFSLRGIKMLWPLYHTHYSSFAKHNRGKSSQGKR